nr:hypothetical protein [uncultured Roseateles sp.]
MRHDHTSLTLLGLLAACSFVIGVACGGGKSEAAPAPAAERPAMTEVRGLGEPQAPLDLTEITPRESAGA